jgi:hypothetical protein
MIRDSYRGFQLGTAAMLGSVALGLLSGCSGSTRESQVSGHISLDGKRIGPGTVVFAPAGGGTPATGSVDDNGNYSMYTSREVGLSAGKYKAVVSIREASPNIKRGDRPPPGKLLIPAKYEDSAKSGLEYDVAPGKNTIDIELKSQSATSAIPSVGSRLSHSGFKAVPSGNMVWGNGREAHLQTTSISTS